MMYLLDSCVCINLMRGKLPTVYEIMRNSDPHLFAVPAIVVAELRFGAQRSASPAKNHLLTERFLAPFSVVPFDGNCAIAYGTIRNHLRRQGLTIGPNDLLIAATAVANQASLVTSNLREFKRVPGLRLENWAEADL